MVKALAVLVALSAPLALATSASAQERISVMSTDAGSCDKEVPVCGILNPERLRPFRNECLAREAGATRVLVGPCIDED